MKVARGIGFGVNTVLLYLGLPLLGWGLGDARGFLSANARLVYGLLVLGFGVAVGHQAVEAPEGLRGSRGREDRLVSRQSIVRIVATLLLFAALVFLPFADRRQLGTMVGLPAVRWVGVVLFGLGCGLVYWSGVALGRLYSPEVTVQEDHHLVTTGPYQYVRHPRYAGAILLGLGLALTFRSWIGFGLAVGFIGVILLRIRDEEDVMREEFGAEWEAYCERSWRLIPHVF
jgi:protein-S-isoprenylcysteine O-methyltransferase Ste14